MKQTYITFEQSLNQAFSSDVHNDGGILIDPYLYASDGQVAVSIGNPNLRSSMLHKFNVDRKVYFALLEMLKSNAMPTIN